MTVTPASQPNRQLSESVVRARVWMPLILLVAAALGWSLYKQRPKSLVVYCAHDATYSESILRDFERQTGIPVHVRFDTEATKSLGLTEQLIRERNRSRCDVFWNNEPLGTMQLKAEGLLLPYKGSGYRRIPEAYKDQDGHWSGFAARMRVWIINTQKLEPTEETLAQALVDDLSRVAMAKPLYGTTRMHYTVLWQHQGETRLKHRHRDWFTRGINIVTGNAHVKNLVAAGTCDLGLTDTDDFFLAKDENQPVAMLPFRLDSGSVILIPNTVAIIKGTDHLPAAQQLVDFLLSAPIELALSRSASRQIPLGPTDEMSLPAEVQQLADIAVSAYPLSELATASEACLTWLRSEYVR